MNKPYDAAIFDLDGTLLDSLADIADSANQVLQRLGLPTHPHDDYRYFVGNGVQILMQRLLPEERQQDLELQKRLIDEMVATYRNNWKTKSTLYEGIPEVLSGLADLGIRIAVLSNKPHASTQMCVEHFLAEFPIEISMGQSADRPHKPHPAGALEIADKLGVEPECCVFVGDTATDMETAVAASMYPLGVTWGFRDRDELLQAGARTVIDQPNELILFLEEKGRHDATGSPAGA
jgi:phosphoglycolate phosphatase